MAEVMDVFASLGISIFQAISISHEPSKLYDTTNSWKPLLRREENFLEILDIPFSPEKSARLCKKVTNIGNVVDALRDLPIQDINTIRVFFVENLDLGAQFMENLGADDKRLLIPTPSFAGCPAMISQWGFSSKTVRWETCSYRLSLEPTLRRGPIRSVDHSYIDSTSIAVGTIRRTLRCMIVPIDDGRIICKYISPLWYSQSLIVSPY